MEKAKLGFTNIIKQNKKRVRFSGNEINVNSQLAVSGYISEGNHDKPEIVKRVKSPITSSSIRQLPFVNTPSSSTNVNEIPNSSKNSSSFDINNLPIAPKDCDIYEYIKKYLKLDIYEADADGNCMFRAVSHQLFGTEKMHWQIRQRALDFINANKLEYQHFILTDVDAYIHKQRQNASFGDHPELSAISYIYRRRIEIYTVPMVRPTIIEYEEDYDKEPIRLLFKDTHYDSIYDPSRKLFSIPDVNTLSQNEEMKRKPKIKCLEEQIIDACLKKSEYEAIENEIIKSELKSTEASIDDELIAASVLEESRYNYFVSILNNKNRSKKDNDNKHETEKNDNENNKEIDESTIDIKNNLHNIKSSDNKSKEINLKPSKIKIENNYSIFEPRENPNFLLENDDHHKPVTDFYTSALMSAHNFDEDIDLQEVLMASIQN